MQRINKQNGAGNYLLSSFPPVNLRQHLEENLFDNNYI